LSFNPPPTTTTTTKKVLYSLLRLSCFILKHRSASSTGFKWLAKRMFAKAERWHLIATPKGQFYAKDVRVLLCLSYSYLPLFLQANSWMIRPSVLILSNPFILLIFKSHLTLNNFWIWRIFFTFLIIKVFLILYSCRKRISLKNLIAREPIRKGENLGICVYFHYRNAMKWLYIDEEVGVFVTG